MKKLFSIIVCLLLIMSMAMSVFAVSSVPEPVMRGTESVVRILAKYADGYATGSGFVIKSNQDETLIATNYHVVEDNPHSISIWIGEDETVSATILAYTDQKDMCILKLMYPVSLKTLTFAENEAKQGDAVYAVGYPGAADYLSDKEAHTSADATITDGIVSAVREATISSYGTPTKILQINAAINSGNSGGPLFNSNGQVIGISTYGINDSQGIFGAIAVSELETFMADHAITIPRGGFSFHWTYAVVAGIIVCLLFIMIIVLTKRKAKTAKRVRIKQIALREYMAKYPDGIGMNNAVAMMLPVALQLRDLHNNGLSHLQVSPNSISVGAKGAVLSNATASESDQYASGYAAPEIYKGIPEGNRSDIYSFCTVLYYVACGRQPENSLSRADTAAEMNLSETFDARFSEILSTGMSLTAENRFASMQDVIIQLSPYHTQPFENTSTASGKTAPAPAIKKKRKASAKVLIPLAAAILILGVTGGYYGCYSSARNAAQKGDFSTASRLLFVSQITELHDANLVAYINAGQLLESRKYDKANAAFTELSGYMNADDLSKESSYRKALQYADANNFSDAVTIMSELGQAGYKDSQTMVLEIKYRRAWALIDEGKYAPAYKTLESIKGYSDVNETLSALTELMYQEGQSLYHSGNYDDAELLFTCISDYSDSKKYMTLINAQSIPYWKTKEKVESLIDIFYFEDAADLLMSEPKYAKYFLLGKWKSSDSRYYFEMTKDSDDFHCSYNLPRYDGKYFHIQDGVYSIGDNTNGYKAAFIFSLLTPDSMNIYCCKDGKTYTLYR